MNQLMRVNPIPLLLPGPRASEEETGAKMAQGAGKAQNIGAGTFDIFKIWFLKDSAKKNRMLLHDGNGSHCAAWPSKSQSTAHLSKQKSLDMHALAKNELRYHLFVAVALVIRARAQNIQLEKRRDKFCTLRQSCASQHLRQHNTSERND